MKSTIRDGTAAGISTAAESPAKLTMLQRSARCPICENKEE
jgi:hypothetical protein